MRYIMKISYDGSNYCGYQIQIAKDTIQGRIENALEVVLKEKVSITASGRTDAGVSAIEQVCHFDCDQMLVSRKVVGYLNTLLPSDIRIISIESTDDNFHARKLALSKIYEYYFYVSDNVLPVYEKIATKIGYNIDIESMQKACCFIKGEHDFSAFCASNTDVKDKIRVIYNISIIQVDENLYKLQIEGNGFLYNMVRIIMGTLVSVGMGKLTPKDIQTIIESKDREKAGKTIASKGLYLKKVIY